MSVLFRILVLHLVLLLSASDAPHARAMSIRSRTDDRATRPREPPAQPIGLKKLFSTNDTLMLPLSKPENDDIRVMYDVLLPRILFPREGFESLMDEATRQCRRLIDERGRGSSLIDGLFEVQPSASYLLIYFGQFVGNRHLTYGQLCTALDLLQAGLEPGGQFGNPEVSFLRIFRLRRDQSPELLAMGALQYQSRDTGNTTSAKSFQTKKWLSSNTRPSA